MVKYKRTPEKTLPEESRGCCEDDLVSLQLLLRVDGGHGHVEEVLGLAEGAERVGDVGLGCNSVGKVLASVSA